MRVLITGGAGFIGSRLAKRLAERGALVTVLDNLSEQIHGADANFAIDLEAAADCVKGDVCDRDLMSELIRGKDVIVHLAAETGTGQSMYAVQRYEHVNIRGTAVLLELLVENRPRSLRKVVVASSRAVYGEGQYVCRTHGIVFPSARTAAALAAGHYEPVCPHCGEGIEVAPTSEDAPFAPSSFYGLTKQIQEQMVLMFASAIGISAFGLRYQNVYGPGQSLQNPYTGLLAVFSNLVRQGKKINIFEDGEESRDFVYVDDVVDATVSCIEPEIEGLCALNVGSGVRTSVSSVARAVVDYFRADTPIEVTGDFRLGDIRHNVADISRIRALTGFKPKWTFEEGVIRFLAWAERQGAADSGFEASLAELRERGLLGLNTTRASCLASPPV